MLVSIIPLYSSACRWVDTWYGCSVTKGLSASMHVNYVVSKAHKRAGATLRTFVSRGVNLLTRAFITIRQTYCRI